MTEASLTSGLTQLIRMKLEGSVVFKHQDMTAGIPDFSVTWKGCTSWWEVKFYNERMFTSTEVQALTAKRLAYHGLCYYIIYEQRHDARRTLLVSPNTLSEWAETPDFVTGFSHAWVVQHVRLLHESRLTSF